MNAKDQKRPKRPSRLPIFLLFIFILAFICWTLPLPKLRAESSYSYKSRPQAVSLAWPGYGQAAVGAVDYGVLDSHGAQSPAPIASISKVITALAVLQKKPLAVGNQGPTLTIGSQDVDSYSNYVAKGGSVVSVSAGEQLSEYQALQAMLLPSANNMADTLASWAFGSLSGYVTFANNYVKNAGLSGTHIDDASGFSPNTVSTAQDLVSLGLMFMNNRVLSSIATQQTAELPVAGTVRNTNWLLGSNGVIGVKTGNTEQAGGCYLIADKRVIDGQNVTVVGAILGAPDLDTAISDSLPLAQSTDNGFEQVVAARKNQIIGIYVSAWGDVVNLVAKKDLTLLNWKTRQAVASAQIDKDRTSVGAGDIVGKVSVSAWGQKNSVAVTASDNIPLPSWSWRLYRRHV